MKQYGSDPATNAFDVTPDDSNDLSVVTRAIYVGTGGDIKVDMQDSGTVTFKSVNGGSNLPYRVKRIYATGTTANDIIGLY